MSNFKFLQKEWTDIHQEAIDAEKNAIIAPRYCGLLCRSALELAIHWIYDNDADLIYPYDKKLAALIHEQCFKDILKPSMFREINIIRINGNNAAHGKKISQLEALVSLKNLFRFLSFLATYYAEEEVGLQSFDAAVIPDGKEADKTKQELE